MSATLAQTQNVTSSSDMPALLITPAAADKIYQLMLEDQNPQLCLRIYITGGGCSGFQYNFAFEDKPNEEDTLVHQQVVDQHQSVKGQVTVIVDPMSLSYLEGATIHYKNDLEGERFVITNPNAKGTCGCGSSFDA